MFYHLHKESVEVLQKKKIKFVIKFVTFNTKCLFTIIYTTQKDKKNQKIQQEKACFVTLTFNGSIVGEEYFDVVFVKGAVQKQMVVEVSHVQQMAHAIGVFVPPSRDHDSVITRPVARGVFTPTVVFAIGSVLAWIRGSFRNWTFPEPNVRITT